MRPKAGPPKAPLSPGHFATAPFGGASAKRRVPLAIMRHMTSQLTAGRTFLSGGRTARELARARARDPGHVPERVLVVGLRARPLWAGRAPRAPNLGSRSNKRRRTSRFVAALLPTCGRCSGLRPAGPRNPPAAAPGRTSADALPALQPSSDVLLPTCGRCSGLRPVGPRKPPAAAPGRTSADALRASSRPSNALLPTCGRCSGLRPAGPCGPPPLARGRALSARPSAGPLSSPTRSHAA